MPALSPPCPPHCVRGVLVAFALLVPGSALAAEATVEKPASDREAPAAAAKAKADEEKASTPKDETPAWETAAHEHRGGFTVGLAAASGLGASNGYPGDSKKIGRERFYTESGLGFAPSSSLWLGGAFADWLTFGVGGGYGAIYNEDTLTTAPTLLFHTDVYPFYPLGGQWRNLGAMAEFGLSFAKTIDVDTEEVLVDGNGASYIFAGGFWEGIEAWKLKMGPYAGVSYVFSQTIRRPVAALGFRISLYTSP
jgi:hypothetical protein